MNDLISRQAAIDRAVSIPMFGRDVKMVAMSEIKNLPSAQPERIQNNAVHLCDSCQYTYVTCPSHGNDAVFGDEKGNDNICACNKYLPIYVQPEIIHCEDCKHHIDGRCLVANHHTADHECCAEVFGAERKEV